MSKLSTTLIPVLSKGSYGRITVTPEDYCLDNRIGAAKAYPTFHMESPPDAAVSRDLGLLLGAHIIDRCRIEKHTNVRHRSEEYATTAFVFTREEFYDAIIACAKDVIKQCKDFDETTIERKLRDKIADEVKQGAPCDDF